MEKELIEFIAKKLVDDPNQVDVQMVEGEKSIVIELRTAREDIGKVIGKQGRIAKAIRSPKGSYRHIDNKEDLKEWLKRELMYYYWCKSECEYVIGGLFNHEEKDLQKLDIWFQLEINLDRIVDYVMKEMNISFKE